MLFSIFFLSCALLCSSVLVLTLSDRYASGNEAVEKEQSRLLAYSGWNMALEQLQLYGKIDAIAEAPMIGTVDVKMTAVSSKQATVSVEALGTVGDYKRTVTGTVQYFPFPFADTAAWGVIDTIAEHDEAAILLVDDSQYELQDSCTQPLGITSAEDTAISVAVIDEITVDDLYICGNLIVGEDASLQAETIYVSGEIFGTEQIVCEAIYSHYTDTVPYQVRVQDRTAG